MSMEVANEKWLGHIPTGILGQFASNKGYADLIRAARKYPALKEFFKSGVTGDVELVRGELARLADATDDPDVASTAKALRNLAEDQTMLIITDGVQ